MNLADIPLIDQHAHNILKPTDLILAARKCCISGKRMEGSRSLSHTKSG